MGTDLGYTLSFYALAGLTVVSALLVVSLHNIFHAVLFLVLTFMGIAGLYLTLNAGFLAAVQVLIYAGAITVLMLFAVFLTRNAMSQGNPASRLRASAFVTGLLMFITLAYVFVNSHWAAGPQQPLSFSLDVLANALFNTYVFPFELASIVLLIAMMGAILLAKE